jgi:hypothetical protein
MFILIFGFFFVISEQTNKIGEETKSELLHLYAVMSVNPTTLLTFECLNQYLRNLVFISWYLRLSEWST